jgi:hypothetical protein
MALPDIAGLAKWVTISEAVDSLVYKTGKRDFFVTPPRPQNYR